MKRITVENLLGTEKEFQIFRNAVKISKSRKLGKRREIVFNKEYPRLDKILLPNVSPLKISKYKKKVDNSQITLTELSIFLKTIYQEQENSKKNNYYSFTKMYPLEIYVLSVHSELPKGVYHYNRKKNLLELLAVNPNTVGLLKKTISNYNLIFFISATFNQVIDYHGNRGYQLILKELGLIVQNIRLSSEILKQDIEIIENYDEDKCNKYLGLDDVNESVLQVISLKNS